MIFCSICGSSFLPFHASSKMCPKCEANSPVPFGESGTKQCELCKQPFKCTENAKTRCGSCDTLHPVQCIECQKEFFPGSPNVVKCNACITKKKEPKVYAKCEKCSSTQNEGKRFCSSCQETKKKQSEPRKCEGCDNMLSHTPRKFCDVCREANEKPQVSGKQF